MNENTAISPETQRLALLLVTHGVNMKTFLEMPIEKQLVVLSEWQLTLEEAIKAAEEINAIQRFLITKYGAIPGASGAN